MMRILHGGLSLQPPPAAALPPVKGVAITGDHTHTHTDTDTWAVGDFICFGWRHPAGRIVKLWHSWLFNRRLRTDPAQQ